MNVSTFNPYVRYIAKVNVPQVYPELYCTYDHRLFYISSGKLMVEFSDQIITLNENDLLTIPPATPYHLVFFENQSFEYYVINFDFDSGKAFTTVKPPLPVDRFEKKDIFSEESIYPFTDKYILHNSESLLSIISEILNEHHPLEEYATYTTSALVKYLLMKIIKHSKKENLNTKSRALIKEIKDYIAENSNDNISNISIADAFGYHPYYLNTLFSKSEGITLHKYILETRMKKAKELMLSTEKSIAQISDECGFSCASYFSECFMKSYGITPTQFRQSSR